MFILLCVCVFLNVCLLYHAFCFMCVWESIILIKSVVCLWIFSVCVIGSYAFWMFFVVFYYCVLHSHFCVLVSFILLSFQVFVFGYVFVCVYVNLCFFVCMFAWKCSAVHVSYNLNGLMCIFVDLFVCMIFCVCILYIFVC